MTHKAYTAQLPVVNDLVSRISLARKDEIFGRDATAVEVGYLHRGPDKSHFQAQTEGHTGALVYHRFGVLDTLHPTFSVERNDEMIAFRLHTVLEVVGIEVEHLAKPIPLGIVGTVDEDALLFFIDLVIGLSIVPNAIPLFFRTAAIALPPYRARGLIKADDIDTISETASLFAKHHLIGMVEYLPRLPAIGCLFGHETDHRQCKQQGK